MKRILFFISIALLGISDLWAQNWVGLTKTTPSEPEVSVVHSDNRQITFSVSLPGFFVTSKTEAGITYQRLSIHGCRVAGVAGEPEIPIIIKHIAVPDCDQIDYSVQITASQTLSDYNVYPVPELLPGNKGFLEEVFTINPLAYLQDALTPAENYAKGETGALRDQHFAVLTIQPIQFNPVTRTLQVATKMEITLTFTNPTTEVNVNTGIFNSVATGFFINYQDMGMDASINDKAFEKPGFQSGSVQWMRINNPLEVENITADYLIICANDFFPGNTPHEEILRLAHHRANYNGYDIMILNVGDIISDQVGFFYEEAPYSPYKKERRIRTCIRTIYETGNAPHTQDGHLGFVLLVGDIDGGQAGNSGMPSSFEQAFNYYLIGAHDYYFSCVTKNGSSYDEVGDLYMGRFCVPNNINPNDGLQKLYNMVEKTIRYETEYTFKNYFNNVNIVYGASMNNGWMDDGYSEMLQTLLQEQNYEEVNVYDYLEEPEVYGQKAIELIDRGSPYLGVFSHGAPDSWYAYPIEFHLNVDYLKENLNNVNKMPLCATHACNVGEMENSTPCIAEVMTSYSHNKGFIAMIASSTQGTMSSAYPFTTDIGYLAPQAIFSSHMYIAGEIFLESRINIKQGQGIYNLFGDPALNIMAQGYEITHDVTAEVCPVEIPYPIKVHNGATLTIPNNCNLHFLADGKLTVEANGSLVIGNDVQVYTTNAEEDTVIHIKGGGFTLGNNVTFNNLNGIVLESYKPTYNANKQFNLSNATFNNTPLTHIGTQLNISNCSFSNRSDIVTTYSIVDINNCSFYKSGFKAGLPKASPLPSPFTPFVKIANSSFHNTGTFICGYDGLSRAPIYSSASIMLDGIKEFQITANTIININADKGFPLDPQSSSAPQGEGIYLNYAGQGSVDNRVISGNDLSQCETGLYVYHSQATFKNNNIHDNKFGVRLFNNSSTSFLGEANASNGKQVIRDNISYEIYASEDAFPTLFKFNQIIDEDNGGNSQNDPLLYYDNTGTDSDAKGQKCISIGYNYWGVNYVHTEDIFPSKRFCTDPIWRPLSGNVLSPEEELYETALEYFTLENYASAKTTFLNLIETYPESQFAIAALHELFALEQFTDNDYFTLQNYYATFTPADSNLFSVAEFLATRCYVQERFWQPAIDWYENRIEDPPSYQDSVFAVIDLGDIHLMMEADTAGNGTKGASACYYRLMEIKPKSKQEYETNKADLLATLPQIKKPKTENLHNPLSDKKGVLGQNIPNPATDITTIAYGINTEGTVEIAIYNAMGQLIKAFPQGTLKEGSYQAKISLAGISNGIYSYVLLVNGERADAKKMVVNW